MKKKKTLLFIIIPLLVIALIIFVIAIIPKGDSNAAISVDSLALAPTTLQSKISSTGVVESVDNKNVYSSLTYPVKAVNVEVGDKVNAGDALCLINSDELTQQIAQKKATLETSNVNSYYQLTQSEKTYNEAKNNLDNGLNTEINSAASALKSAEIDLSNAKVKYENAQKSQTTTGNTELLKTYQAYNTAKTSYDGMKTQYDNGLERDQKSDINAVKAAEEQLLALKKTHDDLKDSLAAVQGKDSITVTQATDKVNKAKQAYDDQLNSIYILIKTDELLTTRKTLQTYTDDLKTAKETYDTQVNKLGGDLLSFKVALDNAQVTYDKALDANRTTQLSVSQKLETYKSDVDKYKKTASNEPTVLELASLQTKLDQCTVTAPISGTVTAVNVKEGAAPNGAMFIIENTDALKVIANVKEYDIDSIAENMKVIIKSDAISDAQYEGYVSKIAPTAVKATATTTSNAGTQFEVEVTVKTPDTKLMIGMNTRLSIISEEKENAYGIRFDAIKTDDDGNESVFIAKDNGNETYTVEEVPITSGLETDFEVEVTGEGITDGTIIITNIDKVKAGSIVRLSK